MGAELRVERSRKDTTTHWLGGIYNIHDPEIVNLIGGGSWSSYIKIGK